MNLDTSKPIKSVSYNGVDVPLFQEAPVLLWTNASPTSNFAEQTVNLPTGYDAYLVEYAYGSTTTQYKGIAYSPFSATVYPSACGTNTNAQNRSYIAGRIIDSCGDGFINFNTGFGGGTRQNIVVDTSYGIPTRIWGVKFTL